MKSRRVWGGREYTPQGHVTDRAQHSTARCRVVGMHLVLKTALPTAPGHATVLHPPTTGRHAIDALGGAPGGTQHGRFWMEHRQAVPCGPRSAPTALAAAVAGTCLCNNVDLIQIVLVLRHGGYGDDDGGRRGPVVCWRQGVVGVPAMAFIKAAGGEGGEGGATTRSQQGASQQGTAGHSGNAATHP